MYPYNSTHGNSSEKIAPNCEMAARGSHWSFVEKARFEAALLKYGPFAWQHIIRCVATRSEKQVKAYAARYRRRKKLAAKANADCGPENRGSLNESLLMSSSLIGSEDSSTEPTNMGFKSVSLEDLGHIGVEDQLTEDLFASTRGYSDGEGKLNEAILDDSFVSCPIDSCDEPSEVGLLVDRVLEGGVVVDDDSSKSKQGAVMGEDSYPVELLNAMFRR